MQVGSTTRRVAIIGGVRTPFARSNTAYSSADNQELLTASLRSLVERFNLHGQRLGDVIAGAGEGIENMDMAAQAGPDQEGADREILIRGGLARGCLQGVFGHADVMPERRPGCKARNRWPGTT